MRFRSLLGSKIYKFDAPAEFRSDLYVMFRDFSDMITTGNKLRAVNYISLKIRLEKHIIVNRTPGYQ